MESILTSIKLMLGISAEDKSFDVAIKTHINSIFMTLNQLGVGPEEGFSITNEMDTWDKFLGDSMQWLEATKSYVYYRVKLAFDPPPGSAHISAMERMADRLEWRLTTQAELKSKEVEE